MLQLLLNYLRADTAHAIYLQENAKVARETVKTVD
jgi:hypothetical protein